MQSALQASPHRQRSCALGPARGLLSRQSNGEASRHHDSTGRSSAPINGNGATHTQHAGSSRAHRSFLEHAHINKLTCAKVISAVAARFCMQCFVEAKLLSRHTSLSSRVLVVRNVRYVAGLEHKGLVESQDWEAIPSAESPQVRCSHSSGHVTEEGSSRAPGPPRDSRQSLAGSSSTLNGDSAAHIYLDLRPFMDQAPTIVRSVAFHCMPSCSSVSEMARGCCQIAWHPRLACLCYVYLARGDHLNHIDGTNGLVGSAHVV